MDGLENDEVAELVAGEPFVELGPLRYRCIARPSYLLVCYEGVVGDVAVAEEWLQALDEALSKHDLSQILWDSRPASPHPPVVRERIWAWLEEAKVLKCSAILVQSEMLRLSGNMSAVGGKLDLRAFGNFCDAEQWLQSKAAAMPSCSSTKT